MTGLGIGLPWESKSGCVGYGCDDWRGGGRVGTFIRAGGAAERSPAPSFAWFAFEVLCTVALVVSRSTVGLDD
jgi:hypothetical protein